MNESKRMGQPTGRNIVVIQPGNRGEAQNCKTAIEAWNLLFVDSILQKVVLHRSEEIAKRTATYYEKTYSGKTAVHNLRAFIGPLYLAGHMNM